MPSCRMGLFKKKAVPAPSSSVSDPVPRTGGSREDEKQWLRRLDREASGHLSAEEAAERGQQLRQRMDAQMADPVGVGDFEIYGLMRALECRASETRGLHYVDWVSEIDHLRSTKNDQEAESLLLDCVAAAERGALVSGREPAPGYTNRLAIIYRRQKRYADEVTIIERWEAACPRERRGPGQLADRLVKARELRDNIR